MDHIGKCPFCGKEYTDTTTCPSCVYQFQQDLFRNQQRLMEHGLWPLDILEWREFIAIGNELTDGKISQDEFEKKKSACMTKAQQRISRLKESRRRWEEAGETGAYKGRGAYD